MCSICIEKHNFTSITQSKFWELTLKKVTSYRFSFIAALLMQVDMISFAKMMLLDGLTLDHLKEKININVDQ